jgi:hypothetical protein
MTSYTRDDLNIALLDYHNQVYSSIRECSNATRIPLTTLRDRIAGAQQRNMAHEKQQALSIPKEHVLVDWIKRLAALGNPITLPLTKDLAAQIRYKRTQPILPNTHIEPLGKRWLDRFRLRHPTIATISSRSLEAARFEGTSSDRINAFF